MLKKEYLEHVLSNGSEILSYLSIEGIGSFIWNMRHDMSHGYIPLEHHKGIEKDIINATDQQIRIVKSLTRFGVENPLDENNRPTENYWKWYRWWNGWHKHTLTEEEWKEVDANVGIDMTEEQIAKYKPNGDWHEYQI